jgi:hypothetical protein
VSQLALDADVSFARARFSGVDPGQGHIPGALEWGTGGGWWYVKFIHMVPVNGDTVNYESKWATLTFQVR